MLTYNDHFGGSPVQPSNVSYVALALSASTSLYWPPFASGSEQAIARIVDVTPSAASLSITLPDARQTGAGQDVLFSNYGSNTYTLLDNAGATVATVAAGQQKYLYLTNNSTQGGTWRVTLFGVGAASPDASQLAGAGLKAIGASLNQSFPVVNVSADQAVDSTFRAKAYTNVGGAINFALLSVATAGNDFFFAARNQGTGVMTITPTGPDLIDGVASIQLQLNESCIIVAGTTAWYTIGRGRNTQFNFTQLSKTVTGGTVTLSLAEASNIVQNYNGVLVSNCIVVLPAVVQVYYISNTTTGAFTLTFQSPTPGSTFILPPNQAAVVFCDGVNVTNTTTTISGVTSLLLNGGSASNPTLAFINANNGLFAPSSAAVAVTAAGVEHMRWSGGQGLSGAGTAAAPAYSFLSEPDTGMYLAAANTLGFATAAMGRMTLDASGHLVPVTASSQNIGSGAFPWGAVYGTTFNGAGTGLTGTAAGLNIGGNAATSTLTTNATNAQYSTTQPPGTADTTIATTAFAAALAFASALPGVSTDTTDLGITNDGAAAAWGTSGAEALAILGYISF